MTGVDTCVKLSWDTSLRAGQDVNPGVFIYVQRMITYWMSTHLSQQVHSLVPHKSVLPSPQHAHSVGRERWWHLLGLVDGGGRGGRTRESYTCSLISSTLFSNTPSLFFPTLLHSSPSLTCKQHTHSIGRVLAFHIGHHNLIPAHQPLLKTVDRQHRLGAV